MQESQCAKYNIAYGIYFNSGIMLINILFWCQGDITFKSLRLLNNGDKYQYSNQNVLNIAVGKRRIILARK
ncbi:hypothetical protein A9G22_03090 [Gilliamella sp. App2-1]|nr:hypothetical protein A9G23_10060 [Gilliamella apicola]OCG25088.1 hypothetical protein A9G22_03090 [Gilliamella apicola]